MNEQLIREQVEILCHHIQREAFDAGFVEMHARFIAEIAHFERECRGGMPEPAESELPSL